jgi:hypothetical protein
MHQRWPDIVYQHSVLCQCALPLRDPGNDVREWEREQGRIQLLVRAGAAVHPETGKLVNVGLPFGPKPRLILAFLNTQAILTDSYRVEVEDSLTRFTDRIGFTKDGRTIRTVKEQLTAFPPRTSPSAPRRTAAHGQRAAGSWEASSCGSPRTRRSASCGRRSLNFHSTTFAAFGNMPFRLISKPLGR